MEEERPAQAILERWREIERRLAVLAPDTLGAHLLRAEAAELRARYQAIFGDATADTEPEAPGTAPTGTG